MKYLFFNGSILVFLTMAALGRNESNPQRVIPFVFPQEFLIEIGAQMGEVLHLELEYLGSPQGEVIHYEPAEKIWWIQDMPVLILGSTGLPLPTDVWRRATVYVRPYFYGETVGDHPVLLRPQTDSVAVGPEWGSDQKSASHKAASIDASYLSGVVNYLALNLSSIGDLTADSVAIDGYGTVVDNAGQWVGAPVSDHSRWSLSGNSGTDPSTHFIGTADNQALEFRVNNLRALRIEPDADSPNLLGGFSGNSVAPGVHGATISGGGSTPGLENRVNDDFGTVGGGLHNQVGSDNGNPSDHIYCTIAGGLHNTASGSTSTVGGGSHNNALGSDATIGGGVLNVAAANFSTVAGGEHNSVLDVAATVGGGEENEAQASRSTVSGGGWNNASGAYASIGGGYMNEAFDGYVSIGGGSQNEAAGTHSVIAGGFQNDTWADYCTVGGGESNWASGTGATIPGGRLNTASGDHSFAAGLRAKATHAGTFVWADSTDADYPSSFGNEFRVRATNGLAVQSVNAHYGGLIDNSTGSGDGLRTYANASGGLDWGALYAVNLGSSPAVYAAGSHAAYFNGNVDVTGTLTKGAGSFKIDHPLDPEHKYLYHSFVESPDMKNVYDGVVELDERGEAWIELPEWLDALNRDFRYQLTAIGQPNPTLYIAEEVDDNRFLIAGGSPSSRVSWQITGIRQDAFAEAHRIPVEQEKQGEELGKLLHPTEHGCPKTKGIGNAAALEKWPEGRSR